MTLALDIVFIVIISIYCYWLFGLLRALKSDAPYVPIRRETLARALTMVSPRPGSVWVDLGSGDGRVLIAVVKKFGVRGVGIERVGSLRLLSRLKIWWHRLGGTIAIRSENFFSSNLREADIVSFYLLPEASVALIKKLRRELKPGALVVYHRYPIAGMALVAHDPTHKIYVARM